ncbi:hypothetical protein [Sinosporangium siamense]|uniref:Uncharacterized protein n=1 Tax=Sinosporangium siamense TaxID=1367973 RepID=A0A919RLU0_9ACTN|nr:hypothetical protein [Sinosporangium siamense]GII94329.1 hypothetical protein Ssi02_45600 [Sinosporangium siamense]
MPTSQPRKNATAPRALPISGLAKLALAGTLTAGLAVPPALASRGADDPWVRQESPEATSSPEPTSTAEEPEPSESPTAVSPERRRCFERTFFKADNFVPHNFYVPRTRFIDGPGGEMTVSITREHEVRAFIEHEYQKELAITELDLVRSLRKQVTPHLEVRHMVFAGHEYTHKINKGRFGNMWYRVLGYRVGWSAWSQLTNCHRRRITTGIANIPARVEGWIFWETRHPWSKPRKKSKKNGKNGKNGNGKDHTLLARPGHFDRTYPVNGEDS